ncbi:MAG: porin family protein [Acidobacteriia bacterium]|nr:porin family protein [Terriglobia bacterium]
MRTIQLSVLFLAAAGTTCFAQQWEVGGGAGAGFLPGVPVTGAVGTATAGFQPGFSFGGFVGQNLYRHLSGELRYGFQQSNLRLDSGGKEATFSGTSHVVHYDLVWHTNKKEDSRTQYFVAAGGGMKLFRGTGKEAAYQPLSQFGYFTKTQAIKPMATIGGGVRYALSPRVYLRAEFRDYITMFPKQLITPAPGTKYGSILHDFVPMVTVSYEF